MFYQAIHSLNADGIKFEVGIDFSFPAHLHDDFELIAITEGKMDVTIDRHTSRLSAGEAVLDPRKQSLPTGHLIYSPPRGSIGKHAVFRSEGAFVCHLRRI